MNRVSVASWVMLTSYFRLPSLFPRPVVRLPLNRNSDSDDLSIFRLLNSNFPLPSARLHASDVKRETLHIFPVSALLHNFFAWIHKFNDEYDTKVLKMLKLFK